MSRLNIAVLYGGVSSERDVSIRSGMAVADALRQAGHEVAALDIASEDDAPWRGLGADVVFIALHGRFGEDGGIQGVLEQEDIPFVGADSEASAAAFDKMASKCFFASHGVPTPDSRAVCATMRWDEIERAVFEIGLPAIIKPLSQGSSVGVTLAETPEEAAEGVAEVFTFGHRALVERFVKGRELTVGILGDAPLPIVELRTGRKIFDHFAKYEDPNTRYIVHPDLPPGVGEAAASAALQAHRCLGCRGMSRVDIMLEEGGAPQVLEVNTIPGFTSRSLFPMAAKAAGIGFPALCERLCAEALESSHARAMSA